MRFILVACGLLISACLPLRDARAQLDPAKVVAAMERVVATFKKASDEKTWFLSPCTADELRGSWSANRFEIQSIKHDVKRTDSLIDPIVGTIQMSVTTYSNGSGPGAEIPYQYSKSKRACYREKSTALSRVGPGDLDKNDSVRPMSATWKIKDGQLYLAEHTEIFENVFKKIIESEEAGTRWFGQGVSSQRIQ